MRVRSKYTEGALIGLNTRTVIYGLLIGGGLLVAMIAARFGFIAGLAFSVLPMLIFFILTVISNPYLGLMAVFVVNYFALGLTRYVPALPGGTLMDLLIGLTLIGIFVQSCYKRLDWTASANGLTVVTGIWMIYCTAELFNIEGPSPAAWLTSVRGVAMYFFILPVITPVIFGNYRDMRRIIYIWSFLTLIAVLKAWGQKTFGFDPYELRWLYLRGEATHLISTGVRYFSIYTDASNYGAGMGFSMVAFSIIGLTVRDMKAKIYFLVVAAISWYGMMISGTRGAIAVPFAGYTLYILLSRNGKVIVVMTIFLIGAYFFLNHTRYLHGNTYVRRMRSAFNTEDPSLLVRLDNQRKMRVYLKSRPFGVGIGMGGGKAKRFAPRAYMSQLATDSWYVMIWVETGIIGLMLYMTILGYIIMRGSYIVMFKVKDKILRGVLGALLSGIFGVAACSYGNEILGQFPTAFIIYTCMAFVFMGPIFDKQIAEDKALNNGEAEVI